VRKNKKRHVFGAINKVGEEIHVTRENGDLESQDDLLVYNNTV